MRVSLLPLIVSVLLVSPAAPPIVITTSARSIQPGELVVLTVTTATPTASLTVRAFDHDLTPFNVDGTTWRVLVGIDLDVKPGAYEVAVSTGAPSGSPVLQRLVVLAKKFPTRRLTVDEAFVNPPPSVLARIDEEARTLSGLWTSSAAVPLWRGGFTPPVPQSANSAFGTRSVLNGTPRSPHGGADFASPTGTPVGAPNGGRVVLAKALYYTGNTVVVDHGAGLVSLFAHLSEIDVHEGDLVRTGAILGKVGATGRVTGPHLHWAVRATGARIDPLSLLTVMGAPTQQLNSSITQ